jgi:hypothetical protein
MMPDEPAWPMRWDGLGGAGHGPLRQTWWAGLGDPVTLLLAHRHTIAGPTKAPTQTRAHYTTLPFHQATPPSLRLS